MQQILVTDDGNVRLSIIGEFSPEMFSALLLKLAETRVSVVRDPATPEGLPVPTVHMPGWHTQPAPDRPGETYFAFCHPGFGWVGLTLPSLQRMQLIGALVGQEVASKQAGDADATEVPAMLSVVRH